MHSQKMKAVINSRSLMSYQIAQHTTELEEVEDMADHKEKVGDVTDINVGDTISRQTAIDANGDTH